MYIGNNKLTQIATEIYFKREHKTAAPMFPFQMNLLKNKKFNFFLWKNI